VLLSSSTRELVGSDLPTGIVLQDLGLYRLKDVDRPERIAQVVAEGLRSTFPPLQGAALVRTPMLRRSRILTSRVGGVVTGPAQKRRRILASALVGVVAAAVAIPVFALGTGHRTIVGTYSFVTHGMAGPAIGHTVKATLRIRTFNKESGAFTGTIVEATKPARTVFALTGMVAGRETRMRAVDSAASYKAHLLGRISHNGTVIGNWTDNNGSRGRWTMTRR
jgi:hypothetical protein